MARLKNPATSRFSVRRVFMRAWRNLKRRLFISRRRRRPHRIRLRYHRE